MDFKHVSRSGLYLPKPRNTPPYSVIFLQSSKNVARDIKLKFSPRLKRKSKSVTNCTAMISTQASSTIPIHSFQKNNPVGLHSQVWVGGWSQEQCSLAISKSAFLGYDLVEISVGEPLSMDIEFTKSTLEEHGIAAATSLGLNLSADISSSNSEIAAKGEQLLLDALQVSSGIGAKYLTGVTYSAIAKYPGPFTGGTGKNNLISAIRNVASQAQDAGITLGLEVVNRYESNVLNTAEQGMILLEEINHPNVVLHLDSYHMNIEEGSLVKAIETCGSKLGYVHIGESHRGYLGTGTIDWPQLFRALAALDYKGPLTFESFSSEVVSDMLSNNLCVWRNLWSDSEDLAKHAKSFIDSQWFAARAIQKL